MRKGFFESKRGISVMVGYVLLVVFLIIISGLVYVWLKTYLPKQALECPDGTSIFIKEASFDSETSQLVLTLRNNGRFDIAGYFIHATNSSEQELPTIDLSNYLDENQEGIIFGNSVLFIEGEGNLFEPGSEVNHVFEIPFAVGELYSVRLIPTRFQESDGKEKFASCSDCRVEQIIGEPYICIADTCAGLGYNCGDWWSDGCGGTLDCGDCTDPQVCNSSGQCVDVAQCTDTCDTYGYECGTWEVCGVSTDCGTCTEPEVCNATGQCASSADNGICESWETCADEDCEGEQNGCEEGEICESGSCVVSIPPAVEDCSDYCVWLGGYTSGNCRQNPAQCTVNGEVYESGGDTYCTVGVTDNCCCIPSGPATLFSDDFEGYTYTSGTNLYNEMASNDWEVFDEGQQDDIYLKDDYRSYDESYVVVRDDSSITASIDTTGYGQITLEYVRRTYSMPYNDDLIISWRVGASGEWTELERVRSDTWAEKQWSLTGAENQATVQIRFFGEGDNDDYSYIDNVVVNGTAT